METELKKARFTFDEDEDFPIFRGWYDPNMIKNFLMDC